MSTDLKRAKLLEVINLLRPAIATADYIPELTHIQFDGDYAMAYNDISAVSVAFATPFKRCVPGDLLSKAVQSMLGESVAAQFDPKTSIMLLSSGRSKIKVPTLPHEDFPFTLPSDTAPEVTLTRGMVRGIEMCLTAVGNDKSHPEQMGVTLDAVDGEAVMYSTDGMTISRYATGAKIKLPGDSPVILPTFFCERVVALSKAYVADGILVLYAGALQADFGSNASVYTKTLVDLEPAPFERPLQSIFPKGYADFGEAVPDALDAAIDRALLVLSREVVRSTTFTSERGTLSLHSTSSMGDADDDMPFGAAGPTVAADPALIARALKQCDHIEFSNRAVVFNGDAGKFVHIVATVAQ